MAFRFKPGKIEPNLFMIWVQCEGLRLIKKATFNVAFLMGDFIFPVAGYFYSLLAIIQIFLFQQALNISLLSQDI